MKVKFTDKSTGSPTFWKWSFGDGTYSTVKNPTYTYNKAGKYTVTLTVKNKAGSSSVTKSNYITVNKPGPEIKITNPKDGSTVNISETARGTSKNIPNDYHIWIMVYPYPAKRYYPQSGAMSINSNGKWSIPIYIGVKNNHGVGFDIDALLADKTANDIIKEYIKKGIETGNWPGMEKLPNGAKIYDKISVIRN